MISGFFILKKKKKSQRDEILVEINRGILCNESQRDDTTNVIFYIPSLWDSNCFI